MTAVAEPATDTAQPLTVWVAAGHGLYLRVAAVNGTVLFAGARTDLDTYAHDDALDVADRDGCSALPDLYGPSVDPLPVGGRWLPRNRLLAFAQRLAGGDLTGAANLLNDTNRGHHA